MSHEFHEFELAICSLGMGHILERSRQFLDSDLLFGHGVKGASAEGIGRWLEFKSESVNQISVR